MQDFFETDIQCISFDEQGVPDLSDFGDVYEVEFGADQLPSSAFVKKEFQRKIIYNMSPLEVIL